MRAKLFFFSSLLLVSLTALFWSLARNNRVDQQIQSEMVRSQNQVAWLAQSVSSELKLGMNLARVLAEKTFGSNAAVSEPSGVQVLSGDSGFIALFTLDRNEVSEWKINHTALLAPIESLNWVGPYLRLALQSLSSKDLNPDDQDGRIGSVFLMLSPNRKPYQVWVMRQDPASWLAAVSEARLARGLIDRSRGTPSDQFVITQNLQVVAHANSEYLGSSLNHNPQYRKIFEKSARIGSIIDPSTQLGFHFERISGTNLVAVDSIKSMNSLQGLTTQDLQIWLLGLGFVLLGAVVIVFLTRAEPRLPGKDSEQQVQRNGLGSTAMVTADVTPLSSTQETQVLVRGLSGPIKRILGRAHVLQDKAKEDRNLMLEAQMIEEGARESFATLQKVIEMDQSIEEPRTPTSIGHCLRVATLKSQKEIDRLKVEVKNEINALPGVITVPSRLIRIFECLIENSIEAMEKSPIRKLILKSEKLDNHLAIQVEDTGQGIHPEEMERIFLPFQSFRREGHVGLGLTVVHNLAHALGIEVAVKSQWGQGTLVTLKIPLPETHVEIDEDSEQIKSKPMVTDVPTVATQIPPILRDEELSKTLSIVDQNIDDLEVELSSHGPSLGEPLKEREVLDTLPEVHHETPSSESKIILNAEPKVDSVRLPKRKPKNDIFKDIKTEGVDLHPGGEKT